MTLNPIQATMRHPLAQTPGRLGFRRVEDEEGRTNLRPPWPPSPLLSLLSLKDTPVGPVGPVSGRLGSEASTRGANSTMRICGACGLELDKGCFSNTQWQLSKQKRRCKECVLPDGPRWWRDTVAGRAWGYGWRRLQGASTSSCERRG